MSICLNQVNVINARLEIKMPEYLERKDVSTIIIQGLLLLGVIVGVAYIVEH